jgi:hypothetical protein
MHLYLKGSIKLDINQHKNDTCHVQSLETDFYLSALGFFYCVFTHKSDLAMYFFGEKSPKGNSILRPMTPSLSNEGHNPTQTPNPIATKWSHHHHH